jgi:hypothetical protein
MMASLWNAHLSDPCSFPRWARKKAPNSMPLDLTMTYSAVRICGDRAEPDGSIRRKVASGTGFIVSVPSEKVDKRTHGYIVTPHHVTAPLSNIYVEIANPSQSGALYPPEPVGDWRRPAGEKVDLAVAPFPAPAGQTPIALELNVQVLDGLVLSPGADFHYVGLLAPLDIPMARSGTIGAIDVAGIEHDGPYDYPAHLADVRSYGGFSGSPCYVEYPLVNLTPLDLKELPVRLPAGSDGPYGACGYLHLLAGMFVEHYNVPGAPAASLLGIGVILPTDTIVEALLSDELRQDRAADDDEFLAREPEQRLDAAAVQAASTDEHANFEDLFSKLIRIPKSEIDEQRAKE